MASTSVRFDFLGRDVSAGRTAQQVEGRFTSLGRTVMGISKVMVTGLAAGAAGGALLGKSMLDVSVKVEAMGNKARVVFGKDFATAAQAADRLNEKLGMTTTETEGLLAGFGDLLIPMGFTTRRATDLSIRFGNLTAALTQWSGGTRTAAEVQDILGDALTGEYDSLKSLGVQIDAATVKELLHRQGKDKLTGAALKQAEAEVVLKEITRQSASAITSYEAGTNRLGLAKQSLTATGKQLREELALRLIPAFAEAGEWLISTGVPRMRAFASVIRDDVIPRVRGAWDALSERMPDLDFSGIRKGLTAESATWAGALIGGVRLGFDKGDWGPLGQSLGRGLARAIDSIAKTSSDITSAIARWGASVDWFAVGMDVGKKAAPFAVGFMSQLGSGLVKAAKEHPFDFAVGIASFFGLGKVAGIGARVLKLVPGLRTVLAPVINAMLRWERFTDPVNKAVGGFVASIGRGFVRAFSRAFPGVGRDLGRHVDNVVTEIGGRALYARDAAFKFAKGIGPGIGDALGTVGIWVGKLIWRLTSPFLKAGGWLVGHGVRFVGGLVSGVGSRIPAAGAVVGRVVARILSPFRGIAGWLLAEGRQFVGGLLRGIAGTSVGRTIGGVISRVTSPFRSAGRWLITEGAQVVIGLLTGIGARMRGVGGWIKRVVVDPIIRSVKNFFGIKSPSTVMAGLGAHLISGLEQGMLRVSPGAVVRKVFGGFPSALGALVTKGLVNIRSLPRKAWDALSGLGGKFAGMLDGIGSFLGGGRGGGSIASLVAFGRWLQSMGYRVSEHPAFGGVAPVHVPGSMHYRGMAIDVNTRPGASSAEQAELARIIGPAHTAGFRTIFMAPGHYDHAHISLHTGGLVTEPVWGVGRSGRTYSFAERGTERVLNAAQTRAYGSGGGTTVIYQTDVHLHGVVSGSEQATVELVSRSVKAARRSGHLHRADFQ